MCFSSITLATVVSTHPVPCLANGRYSNWLQNTIDIPLNFVWLSYLLVQDVSGSMYIPTVPAIVYPTRWVCPLGCSLQELDAVLVREFYFLQGVKEMRGSHPSSVSVKGGLAIAYRDYLVNYMLVFSFHLAKLILGLQSSSSSYN